MNSQGEKVLRNEMSKYLLGMGVYPNINGFENLINSVILIVRSEKPYENIGQVFEIAGKKTNKSASAVERSIRTLILRCEAAHTFNKLNEYFGYTVYRENYPISASELVYLFATKLSLSDLT